LCSMNQIHVAEITEFSFSVILIVVHICHA